MTTETHITVRYAETDQMGITHHSVYPIWFEAARSDWVKQLGITYAQLEKMGVMTRCPPLNANTPAFPVMTTI